VLPGIDLGQVNTYVPLSPSSITWYRCKAGEVTAGCGRGEVYCPLLGAGPLLAQDHGIALHPDIA